MARSNDTSHAPRGTARCDAPTTRRHGTAARARHGMLVATVAIALSLALPASQAGAATLDELGRQLQQTQAVAEGRQRACDDAESALRATVSATYKGGAVSVADMLSSPQSVQQLLAAVKYGNAMMRDAADKVTAARQARQDAEDAYAEAQRLYDRKARQEESLRNADGIHFAQSSSPWGQMAYWNGTVATHGCGLVSYTVAIDILTGRGETPDQVLEERGDWAGTEQTLDATTGNGSRTHYEVTKALYDVTTESLNMDGDRLATLDAALQGESVVQVCAAGRAFKNNAGVWRWSGGHYVVIYRRADDGGYMVQDSTWTDKGTAVHYSRDEMGVMLSHAHTLTAYRN